MAAAAHVVFNFYSHFKSLRSKVPWHGLDSFVFLQRAHLSIPKKTQRHVFWDSVSCLLFSLHMRSLCHRCLLDTHYNIIINISIENTRRCFWPSSTWTMENIINELMWKHVDNNKNNALEIRLRIFRRLFYSHFLAMSNNAIVQTRNGSCLALGTFRRQTRTMLLRELHF